MQPLIRTKMWMQALLFVSFLFTGIGTRAQSPESIFRHLLLGCTPRLGMLDFDKKMSREQMFERAKAHVKAGELIDACHYFNFLAEKGHTAAQYELGIMYQYGRGVGSQDTKEAERWLRLAAEKGHADAQSSLGTMYLLGNFLPKNLEEALRFIRMAAEQGHSSAAANLADMYDLGNGVDIDQVEAVKWYRVAAEQGGMWGQSKLAKKLIVGEGVQVDLKMAYFWILLSVRGGFDNGGTAKKYVEERITPVQRAAAQKLANDWRPKSATRALQESEYQASKPNRNATPGATNQAEKPAVAFGLPSTPLSLTTMS